MRTYDDTFSGEKIYPGKVRITQNTCEMEVAIGRNPTRRISMAPCEDKETRLIENGMLMVKTGQALRSW